MSVILSNRTLFEGIVKNKHLMFFFGLSLFFNKIVFTSLSFSKFALNYLFQSIGISFIITYVYLKQDSIIVKCLDSMPLKFIGKISYGLYIRHVLFCYLVFSYSFNIYMGIILSFFIATLSYLTIEKYFLSKKASYSFIKSK